MDLRVNIAFSALWYVYGSLLAAICPWLTVYASPLDLLTGGLAICVTAGLLGWNSWISFRAISETGRLVSALPLTALHLPLFSLFFYQIYSHFGAHHFTMGHPPLPWDWLLFTCSQAFRAADLLDVLQAYGVDVAIIRHNSVISGVAVMCLRLLLDVFLLKVIMSYLDEFKSSIHRRLKSVEGFGDDTLPVLGLLGFAGFVCVWLSSALYFRPWPRKIDLLLWPIENSLRVLDFPDAMEILGLRFHQVPAAFLESTLAIIFRVFVALVAADALNRILFRWLFAELAGHGWTVRELERIVEDHRGEEVAGIAKRRLKELHKAGSADVTAWRSNWHQRRPLVWVLWAAAAGLLPLFVAALNHPAESLARRAVDGEQAFADHALVALEHMGSSAAAAVPILQEGQLRMPTERRSRVIETMGHLGNAAIPPLRDLMLQGPPEFQVTAAKALGTVGPAAVGTLFDDGMASPREEVREAARAAILDMGSDAVRPLIATLSEANVIQRVPLLRELDSYWELYRSSNPVFRTWVANRERLQILEFSIYRRDEAVSELSESGAVAAVPLWERIIASESPNRYHLEAFFGIQPRPVELVLGYLESVSDAEGQRCAQRMLSELDGLPLCLDVVQRGKDNVAQAFGAAFLATDSRWAKYVSLNLAKLSPEERNLTVLFLLELGPGAIETLVALIPNNEDGQLAIVALRDGLLAAHAQADRRIQERIALCGSYPRIGDLLPATIVAQESPPPNQESEKVAMRPSEPSAPANTSASANSPALPAPASNPQNQPIGYTERLARAERARTQGDSAAMRRELEACAAGDRDWEWYHLWAATEGQAPLNLQVTRGAQVHALFVSADGQYMAVISVEDPREGGLLGTGGPSGLGGEAGLGGLGQSSRRGFPGVPSGLASQHFAVRVWNLRGELLHWHALSPSTWCAQFSPTGQYLIAGPTTRRVAACEFSPDNRWLAVPDGAQVLLMDLQADVFVEGREPTKFTETVQLPAGGKSQGKFHVLEIATGKLRSLFEIRDKYLSSPQVLPGGTSIAGLVTDPNGVLEAGVLLNAQTRAAIRTLPLSGRLSQACWLAAAGERHFVLIDDHNPISQVHILDLNKGELNDLKLISWSLSADKHELYGVVGEHTPEGHLIPDYSPARYYIAWLVT